MEDVNLTAVLGHGVSDLSEENNSGMDAEMDEMTPRKKDTRRASGNSDPNSAVYVEEPISVAKKRKNSSTIKFADSSKNSFSSTPASPRRPASTATFYSNKSKVDLMDINMKRPPREPIDPIISMEGDSASYLTYLAAIFYPEVYMKIFYAFRITLMVALPLALLERHPSVLTKFSAATVLPLWGIVDCKYHVGEQIAQSIVSYQCGFWMMMWGTMHNSFGLKHQHSAWWCAVIFGAFVVSLFGDVRGKRLFVLQGVMILQMEYLPGGTDMRYCLYVGRDMIMATTFALVQSFFPPRTNAREIDSILAKCFTLIYHVMDNCVKACWSDDPIDCALALRELSTENIQDLINLFPVRAFFVMYEFWESTLRLELRKERMEYVKGTVPFVHALTDCARGLATRRLQRLRVMKDKERQQQQEAELETRMEASSLKQEERKRKKLPNHEPFSVFTFHDQEDHRDHVRSNTFSAQNKTKPKLFHSDNDTLLWQRSREMLAPGVEHFLLTLKKVIAALNNNLNPKDVAENVPFEELKVAAEDIFSNLNKVHFNLLIKGDKPVNPFVYTNTIFFHISLISIAEHLCGYGERMQTFERSRYKSQWVRVWEFFFYDYWRKFWEDLPNRLLLKTERDIRIVKDAIKMACAYGLGAMFTQYTDENNAYYFGMAILMGVGWPTAGDTMVASVYRITGMVCACSIAYIAIWHSNNLAGELAIALVGVFIALLFRDVPPYSHTAQYCSMLICTCLNSASTKLVLLSRIVSNCFTVMTYYVICVFIFPIDVLRVTYCSNVRAIHQVMERFSGLVDLALLPYLHSPSSDSSDEDDDDEENDAYSQPEREEKETLIKLNSKGEKKAQLRKDIKLIGLEQLKMLHAQRAPMWKAVNEFGTWVPKAAAHPTTHGIPYPVVAMKNVYSSLKRLASATDLLYSNLATLYRSNEEKPQPLAEEMVWAILPVLVNIDSQARILMQDFVNAMAAPLTWDLEKATAHFSNFLAIGSELHTSFEKAHRRYVAALRKQFREKVMQRALEAAASSFCLPLDQLPNMQQMANESFAASKTTDPRAPDVFTVENSEPLSEKDGESVYGDDPLGLRPPGKNDSSTGSKAVRGSKDSKDEEAGVEESDEEEEIHFQASFVADAVVQSISNASFGVFKDVNANTESANGDAQSLNSTQHNLTPSVSGGYDQTALKEKILPFTEMAENDEFHDFIRPKNQTFTANLQPERFTISHEVNVLISILVATDMFFGESERLLKTMYEVNKYARSRVSPGKRSIRDIVDF